MEAAGEGGGGGSDDDGRGPSRGPGSISETAIASRRGEGAQNTLSKKEKEKKFNLLSFPCWNIWTLLSKIQDTARSTCCLRVTEQ